MLWLYVCCFVLASHKHTTDKVSYQPALGGVRLQRSQVPLEPLPVWHNLQALQEFEVQRQLNWFGQNSR